MRQPSLRKQTARVKPQTKPEGRSLWYTFEKTVRVCVSRRQMFTLLTNISNLCLSAVCLRRLLLYSQPLPQTPPAASSVAIFYRLLAQTELFLIHHSA